MGTVSEQEPHHTAKPRSVLSDSVLALTLLLGACFPARTTELSEQLVSERPAARVIDPPEHDSLEALLVPSSFKPSSVSPPILTQPILTPPILTPLILTMERPERPLIAMGGGEPDMNVLELFCKWSGGK